MTHPHRVGGNFYAGRECTHLPGPRRMTHETKWNSGDFSRESKVCHVAETGEHETHSRSFCSETRGGSPGV